MAIDWDSLVLAPAHAIFGEASGAIVYTPQGHSAFTLTGGVFDAAYREIDQLGGVPVSSTMPVLGVRLAVFPTGIAPAQSDTLTIGGVSFVVREVRPDGHGEAKLMLNLT